MARRRRTLKKEKRKKKDEEEQFSPLSRLIFSVLCPYLARVAVIPLFSSREDEKSNRFFLV